MIKDCEMIKRIKMRKSVKKNVQRIYLLGLALIFGASFSSCEQEGAEYIDELDTIVTRYDDSFDFTTVNTYVMPDTIIYVPEVSIKSDSREEFDRAILQQVAQNFENLGYVRLEEGESESVDPDVIVTLTIMENDVYAVYPYPWYNYWAWYDWGYWGYPWIGADHSPYYPAYWGVYAYSTGTLVLDMMQPVQIEQETRVPVVWNGLFNGIASYGLDDRMLEGIDQMFEQSPYLSQE
jgi:hypothetical protein